jgi:nitrogen regulatory protein PII
MKMLLIVFRQSMVEHIHALLKEYDVNAFTELHNVAGRGET